jgi:F-type H+-transporting ATPase subunit b
MGTGNDAASVTGATAAATVAAGGAPELPGLKPEPVLLAVSWVTFLTLLFVLTRIAWRPILHALARREETIRDALENAERARSALQEAETRRRETLDEADRRAKLIVASATRVAEEAGRRIQESARAESETLLATARRDIAAERERAAAELRSEAAALAVDLAGRILADQIDGPAARRLAEASVKQVTP